MKKEILIVLLNEFADWESAFIAPNLNCGVEPGSECKYIVKTLSLTKEPVISLGGFRVIPDYDLSSMPNNYAGLILIGGTKWFTPETEQLVPIIREALKDEKLVAGICNASVFLGKYGFLNNINHTSNGIEYLKAFAGPDYSGVEYYVDSPAVRADNIVTAGGLGTLEFCREILIALEADTLDKIERGYRMYKSGVWEMPESK